MWRENGNMSETMGTTCERRMETWVNQWEPHVKGEWEHKWANGNHMWKEDGNMSEPVGTTCERRTGTWVSQWEHEWTNVNHMWKENGNMSEPMGTTCERRMGTWVNQCEPHMKGEWEHEWANGNHMWSETIFLLTKTGEIIICTHHCEDVKPPNLKERTEVQLPCNKDIYTVLFPHKEHILLP
jgi:hypothetical protein